MTQRSKTLVFIVGPPAVGKRAVGEALYGLTGIPLFHNHLSIEAVLPVFDFGHPAFGRLVTSIRRSVIEEVAKSELPGVIFTYVWAFDQPGDRTYVENFRALFERHGGRVVFVELWADLQTRLERNAHPDRLDAKASKRDVASSNARLLRHEREHRLSSGGVFPMDAPYLFLDNSELAPADAAERIVEHFDLPRRGAVE